MNGLNPQLLSAMIARMGISPDAFADQIRQGAFSSANTPPIMRPDLSEQGYAQRMRDFEVWLANDRKLGPEKPALRDRSTLVMQYKDSREQIEAGGISGQVSTRTTFIGFEKHSSKIPLEQLKCSKVM